MQLCNSEKDPVGCDPIWSCILQDFGEEDQELEEEMETLIRWKRAKEKYKKRTEELRRQELENAAKEQQRSKGSFSGRS